MQETRSDSVEARKSWRIKKEVKWSQSIIDNVINPVYWKLMIISPSYFFFPFFFFLKYYIKLKIFREDYESL